ncbi:hypothetical protein L195_g014674 [Trifolium pratense]|uniref:Uncharacterized protein n=1 Tax=Trifolium pratense TaxID=57577 RepID=A0A2K3JR45_TRIPR|nr:hypothetical protein L195_g049914 [Trifolium pratense]PNY17918.1 hypothetical protein L195_g014674 [Trifolium pratense]
MGEVSIVGSQSQVLLFDQELCVVCMTDGVVVQHRGHYVLVMEGSVVHGLFSVFDTFCGKNQDPKTLESFFCVLLNKIICAILPADRVAVALVIVSVIHIGCCGQRFARNRHFAAG